MSDDNNQKSRGPRKGGGTGGRGPGSRGGGRPPGRGGKPGQAPFRSRDGEDRPRRPRAASPEGAERRIEGERPAAKRFEKKPFRERPTREGAERPFRSRDGDERGSRPAGHAGERAPRPARGFDDRPAREGGERPFRSRDAGERASRPPGRTGERPQRGERPAFGRDEARPARQDRPRGERSFGERAPAARGGEERPEKRGFGGARPERARSAAPRADKPFRPRGEGRRPPREEASAPAPRLLESVIRQEPERIAKVMARAGVASRRDSEAIIAEGRVSVNGQVIDSPALDIGPNDIVLVDGEPLPARERTRLWLYHKPRGLVTTNHDPEGRPTVFDALPDELPRVLSIGRLDINTEGLLLLTNDGGLARMLELPETGWLRRYRVRAFGQVTQDRLDSLRDGVTIDGVAYGPVVARFEREQGSNTWLTVDLREGKNREVKTVLEHLGLAVNRLIRVSFGPFQLGDLAEGEVDEIRSRVLKDQLGEELMAKAGVDFESPRRDELPPAPPARAPSGDDRPRRRPRSEGTDARPADRGDKPWNRTVWRDSEAEPKRERKAPPRRGADPREERQAREAAGAVERRRDKPIADPKGRRVLVERVGTRDEARSAPAGEGAGARAPRRDGAPRGVTREGERPARAPRAERSPGKGGKPGGFGKPGGRPGGGRPPGKGPRPGGGRDRRG